MKNTKALYWLYKHTKKYLPLVGLIALLTAVVSVGYIMLAYVSSFVIDIATGAKSGNIKFYIALLFLLILVQAVMYVLSSSIRIRVNGKIEMHLKTRLFSTCMSKKYSEISKLHSGDILNRFTADVEVVVGGIVGIIPSAVSLTARIIAAMVVLIKFSPVFAVVILLIGIVVGFAARIYSKFYKNIHKSVQQSQGEARSFAQECLENITVVKAFGGSNSFADKLSQLLYSTFKLKLTRNAISNIANVGIYLLFTGGYYAALSWGAFMVSGEIMTYGTLTALLAIVAQIRTPITNMSGLIPQYYSMIASAERIMEIEDIPDEPQGNPVNITELYTKMNSLVFENVTFSYDGKKQCLVNSFVKIDKGDTVALVGNSGEGKSTLFRLALDLYEPDVGSIYLDCIDEKIPVNATVRSLFAYVPQGNPLLSGTIAENIRFCRTDATDEEVFEAAKIAEIYDFINELPDGFNTKLGEHGHGLSEGQLQRVSIARALVCGAPILLLDECTSALDGETEAELLHNLRTMTDKTVIIISHRPAALEICNKIFTVSDGNITCFREDK